MERPDHPRCPYLVLPLQRKQKITALKFETQYVERAETAQAMTVTALLSAAAMIGALVDDPASEIELHFPWPHPRYYPRKKTLVANTLRFDQPHCAMVLSNETCRKKSPYSDQSLLATALAALERGSHRLSNASTLTLKIDDLLRASPSGRLSQDEIARELAMSTRTLVRRLTESGMTFRSILNESQKHRAKEMIEEGRLSRSEMAERLGFQDPTSFSRACRRWFGPISRVLQQPDE